MITARVKGIVGTNMMNMASMQYEDEAGSVLPMVSDTAMTYVLDSEPPISTLNAFSSFWISNI